jgi:prepilin-type N-terminal cleavage/methylation domain-containing protein
MLKLKHQSGFTLIEVVLTLAITGLLVLAIGLGQFSSAMDITRNNLVGARTEAFSSYNASTGATGASSSEAVLGRLVTFDTNTPGSYTVETIKYNQISSNLTSGPGTGTTIDQYTTTIPWDVIYTGSSANAAGKTYILFERTEPAGDFAFYYANSIPGAANIRTFLAIPASSLQLNFRDPTGKIGFVVVNPADKTISRIIP